jgi:hypothetical protein
MAAPAAVEACGGNVEEPSTTRGCGENGGVCGAVAYDASPSGDGGIVVYDAGPPPCADASCGIQPFDSGLILGAADAGEPDAIITGSLPWTDASDKADR